MEGGRMGENSDKRSYLLIFVNLRTLFFPLVKNLNSMPLIIVLILNFWCLFYLKLRNFFFTSLLLFYFKSWFVMDIDTIIWFSVFRWACVPSLNNPVFSSPMCEVECINKIVAEYFPWDGIELTGVENFFFQVG